MKLRRPTLAPDLPGPSSLVLVRVFIAATLVSALGAIVLLVLNRNSPVPGSAVDLDQMLAQPGFFVAKIVAAVLFAVAGWLLATRRPDVPLGYLAFVGGLANAVGVLGCEWAVYARVGEHQVPLVAAALWLGSMLFSIEPAVIVGFYLFFPHGNLPRPPAVWFAGLAFALCVVGAASALLAPLHTDPNGAFSDLTNPLGSVSFSGLDAFLGVGLLLGNGVLVVRWIRSRDEDRRAFRALAVIALIGFILPLLPVNTETARVLYEVHTLLLVLAVLTSVLRHRLYGIDLVLNRTLVYLILSALVASTYALLVGVLVLVAGTANLFFTPVAAVVAAMCLLPAREGVQRMVNRFLYGQRDEPFTVISRIAGHLETSANPGQMLEGLLYAVVDSLRLPAAELALSTPDGIQTTITAGTMGEATDRFPLTYQGARLGELVVTRRPGQRTLPAEEAALLAQVARQSAVAAQSVILLEQLTRSRERVVGAAEEERRKLRRDLHDGLGPLLTAAAARIDACRNLLTRDVPQVESLLDDVRDDLTEGLTDLRRLVYSLRPPALDQLGLVQAVNQICARSGVPTDVDVPVPLPDLPAAVEITAYRIVAEAVTNVVRHAGASRCTVRMAFGDRLVVEICDDGTGTQVWQAGVGLSSMRERTAELGGRWSAGPGVGGGGQVHAELPLTLFGVTP